MMKSFISLVAVVMLGSSVVTAQTEQGKKYLYYKRYKSAKETLEKVVAANPNDIEATYWLGQTLIELKDSIAAKNLYSKLLQQNGNAPLVLAGMGQIELMEGKTNDARQRFEVAISTTKGRDIDVLNAVARANINARLGDANYAIQKLTEATQVKRFNDPTTYLLMGDAYRKLIDGGNAVTNYEKAFSMNNKLAEAKWSIGKIYLTQQNGSYFIKGMEDAIAADPDYAPAFYDLHVYYFDKDVNKSRENFLKYKAVADPGPELEYLETSMFFASRQFQQAIDQSKQRIQQYADKADPRYYKLTAYSYAELKDTANAKTYMDQYFAKQKPDDFVPKDYSFYAQILGRTKGSEMLAFAQYEKAVQLDTAKTGKLSLMEEAARLATAIGDKEQAAIWNSKKYYFDTAASSNRDLYDYGFAHYQAGHFDSAYNIFKNMYQVKYPDEIYGYLWASRAAQVIDSTWEQGLAASETQLYAAKATEIDSVKLKSQIIYSYKLLAQYQNNIKKDRDSAIAYLEKVVALDPNDKDAPRFIETLKKSAKQPAKTGGGGTSAATKPNGSTAGSNKR